MLFISDLSGDEWDEAQATEEWTNAIDRGGLWHVSDATYTIFYLMEEEIRKHLIAKCAKNYNDGMKRMLCWVMKSCSFSGACCHHLSMMKLEPQSYVRWLNCTLTFVALLLHLPAWNCISNSIRRRLRNQKH